MTNPSTLKKNPHSSLVKFSDIKAKLILSQTVVEQITFLCTKIPNVEWSGVLYHTSEGDIGNPKDFICKAEYVLPLDKGSSAYTEYDFSSPNFTEALMERPELMEWSMSHIHSHNTMGVFFSGTDNDELTDNAPNYNYYLSLIVNNKNEYCARIAFIGEIEGRVIKFNNKDGVPQEIKVPNQLCTFYHEVDIVTETGTLLDEFFLNQYKKVDVVKPIVPYHQTYSSHKNGYNSFDSQHSFDFNEEYKWDSQAAAFIRWLLSKPLIGKKGKNLYSCKHFTVQAALDSINIYNLNHVKFIEEQIDNAGEIYEAFATDKDYESETTLNMLWESCINLLSRGAFKNNKTAQSVAASLKLWKWE